MIKMGSFRSYVDLEEYEMKIPAPVNGAFLQPKFIPGELVIAEATNALKFTSLSKTKGLSGSLFVTNARVVFVSSDHVCSEDSFPLLSVNTLWYYESHSKSTSSSTSSVKKTKRRIKLGPMKSSFSNSNTSTTSQIIPSLTNSASLSSANQLIPSSGSNRVHELFLICSNFRTLRISFKFSPIDQGLRICNAIIHHTFPQQLERLFYFDFCKAYTAQYTANLQNGGGVLARSFTIPSYMDKGDWLRELNITRTTPGGYRISGINEGFQLCGSLPEWVVVPSDVNDARVMNLAEKLKGCRPPHWTWGDSRGAAILIMGKLNNEQDSSAENSFFESLRKVHPQGMQPTIHDLDTVVTLKEIRQSFVALVDLCCPESLSQYQDVDSKFYSALEHTKWMMLISRVLGKCSEVVDAFKRHGNAMIFQEQEGRDVACLFSSLVQLLVDARFRTVSGFFTLIQKEWVAFGHPFHSTHLHTSPVFLLFLDCVFQLLNQNPLDFEFNERLLSSLWDSMFDCTTGTFLFDSPEQRKRMELSKESTAWISIFSSANSISPQEATSSSPPGTSPSRRDQLIPKVAVPRSLLNPLYQVKSLLTAPTAPNSYNHQPTHNISLSNTQILSSCNSVMCDLTFWENLYLHRTLEITPMIVTSGEGMVNSDPLQLAAQPSPVSSTSTPSPSPSSKFYFPLPAMMDSYQQRKRPGRDTLHELQIVEDLLQNLGATTRFQQRSYSSTAVPGASSSAGLLQQRHATSSSSAVSLHHRGRLVPTSASATSSPVFGSHASASRLIASNYNSASTLASSPGNAAMPSSSTSSSSPRRNPFMNLTTATSTASSSQY